MHIIEEIDVMIAAQRTSAEEDKAILSHLQNPEDNSEGHATDDAQPLRGRLDTEKNPACMLHDRGLCKLDRKDKSHMLLAVQYRLQRKLLLGQVHEGLQGQLQLIGTCRSSQVL